MSKFDEVARRLEKVMDDAKKEAKDAFVAELKDIFNRVPDLKVIKWVQYTPYFNDGDACTFRVGELIGSNHLDVNHYGEYEEDVPDDLLIYGGYGEVRWNVPDLHSLEKFMNTDLGESVLLFAFGDHVEITVTPNGIDIDDFDHD
jgi:hypothetical protein